MGNSFLPVWTIIGTFCIESTMFLGVVTEK